MSSRLSAVADSLQFTFSSYFSQGKLEKTPQTGAVKVPTQLDQHPEVKQLNTISEETAPDIKYFNKLSNILHLRSKNIIHIEDLFSILPGMNVRYVKSYFTLSSSDIFVSTRLPQNITNIINS